MGCVAKTVCRLVIRGVCVVLLISSAYGDGIMRDGVGAISVGRGGTNLGFADNGEIILDNPGAMVNIAGSGLNEIGLDVLFTNLSYRDPDNSWSDSSDNPFPVGQFSMIRRVGQEGNVALGFGAFSVAGFSTKYTLNGPFPYAGARHYKSLGALMRILPSMSVAMTDRWSVGGTLGVAVSHMELEGPYSTNYPGPFYGTPTLMDTQGTGAGLSWSIGSQYLLSDRTTVGLSFQAETRIDLKGSTSLTIPGLGTSRFDSEMATEWPAVLGLGFAHFVTPRSIFSTDIYWSRWSDAKHGYDMALTNPNNPVFAAVLGPAIPERFPLNWRDSVAVRLGYQIFFGNRTLRTGYVYHANPIPTDTLTPYIQATVEHAVSVGYGFQFGSYGIDLGYQYTWGPDVNVATSSLAGHDFHGSTTSASAHWALLSLIRRF